MVALIYDVLLIFMLFVLYRAGIAIRKSGKILSPGGLAAVLVYTLNEGLRFGRGIDYNLYGMAYERLTYGYESNWDSGFLYFANILIGIGVPWQGYVVLMSGVFIASILILLKVYREILPIALPIFVFFSMAATENMVRWYFAFSFVLIAVSILLNDKVVANKKIYKFFLYTAIACTLHIAILPIPIAFLLLSYRKTPILSPMLVIVSYFVVAFSFQTDYMLRFVEVVNILSQTSVRFEKYTNKADYWLTGGFAGTSEHSAFPGISELLFLCCLVVLGHKALKYLGHKYVYAYNLFVIGLLVNPIARQIELIGRYDQTFFFFRAVVLASAIELLFIKKLMRLHRIIVWSFLLLIAKIGVGALIAPFKTPEKYLYVWDTHGKTYQAMYDMWISEMYKKDNEKKRAK